MKTILVDDIRDLKADVICRTFNEGYDRLYLEKFDILYLDHDLGCWELKTGRDLNGALLLERLYMAEIKLPGTIHLISDNPVGKARQKAFLEDIGYMESTNGNSVMVVDPRIYNHLVHISDIVWETDGKKTDLPHTIFVSIDEVSPERIPDHVIEEDVTDFLSNTYKYLVKSCNYKIITKDDSPIQHKKEALWKRQ